MATASQILSLRRLIDDADPTPFADLLYTDLELSTRIDAASGNLKVVAISIWEEKAAKYAGLIDIQEGNSNRKMSQLYTQALKMAGSFTEDVVARPFRAARTRKIERF